MWFLRVGESAVLVTGERWWSSDNSARIKPVAPVDRRKDEADLLEAGRRGDPAALEELIRQHGRQVYRVAFRFFRNRSDAEEMAQEVFVRAYREWPRFRGGARLGTWLYRITVNACLDRKRRERVRQEVSLGLAAAAPAGAPDPFAGAVSRQFVDRVAAAMDELPPRQRAIFILRIYEELSLQEIADVLESPLGTVKANLHHALVKVRRALHDLIGRAPEQRNSRANA